MIDHWELFREKYIGRGLIIGLSPDEKSFFQIYWLTGRSENSRNRIISEDRSTLGLATFGLKVEPYEGEVENPELHIYHAMKDFDGRHIVSNGNHTDTLLHHIIHKSPLEKALKDIDFEPDEPNYTPRIGGVLDVKGNQYQILISKTHNNDPNYSQKHIFSYEQPIPGIGHMIATYMRDAPKGQPLPSFQGEPLQKELCNTLEENYQRYLHMLEHNENFVSLAVKRIDVETGDIEYKIYNAREEE